MTGERKASFATNFPDPLRAVRESLERMLRPIAEAQEAYRRQIEELTAAVEEAAAPYQDFTKAIKRTLEPFADLLRGLAEHEALGNRLYASGWLPHGVMPIDLLRETPEASLQRVIDEWTADHWSEIRSKLKRRFGDVGLDDDSFETIRNALDAHAHGLFRLVPPAVFMAIERTAWIKMRGRGNVRDASLQDVRKQLMSLSPADCSLGIFGLKLVCFIDEHCYADTNAASAQCHIQSFPNRHAAIHGRVVYASHRDSLNALFIADVLFTAMRAILRR